MVDGWTRIVYPAKSFCLGTSAHFAIRGSLEVQSKIDIMIGPGGPIFNDIARISLYFGGTMGFGTKII